ncbi:MAG: hypothetical protein EON92_20040, partial [Burkholderiales bacterium]
MNLKFDDFNTLTFDNVAVKNSGYSSNTGTGVGMVIKTRGISGDSSDYTRAPASLQSVNITGGSIEGSTGTGIRFETLSNGNGGQPVVRISGTQFKNNRSDIAVDRTNVDARGAVFVGAGDGFAIEDRVLHALDTTGRGLVTWDAGNVYVTQSSGSIQRGVDASAAGSTVNVAGGTFAEDVSVNTPRNLKFNTTTLGSLALGEGAAGSGIGGTVTAYGAGGFAFDAKASFRLLSDTTLATTGADIKLLGDIQNDGAVARALRLIAGSGTTRGNVHMNTGGSASGFLGALDVSANNFKLDSTLNAGGDVTGSINSLGNIEIVSGGDIQSKITAKELTAEAQGSID